MTYDGHTYQIETDDSQEPITAEWFHALPLPGGVYLIYGVVMIGSKTAFHGCKTRGDLRELCRLLGVALK